MDSVESFSRAWTERFPQDPAPELSVIGKHPQSGEQKDDDHDGVAVDSLTGLEDVICQKEKQIYGLKRQLEKEEFVLEYLEGILAEREAAKNGEKENYLLVPGAGPGLAGETIESATGAAGRGKLVRGRPLVHNTHWHTRSIDSERSDEDDSRSKSPDGNRKGKVKVPKPKHVASSSFANRSNNAPNIPARSASMNTTKTSEKQDHAALKQTISDAPAVPPKPRRTKVMQQLIDTMGESLTEQVETPPPVKPRDRSHSREKLEEISAASPGSSPRVSPRSSPKSNHERQGSKFARDHGSPQRSPHAQRRGSPGIELPQTDHQRKKSREETDDIPRAKDLPSSLRRKGPPAAWKKGSGDERDKGSRESSPRPNSERRGSKENLLSSKSGHEKNIPPGIQGKPRSESAGNYQELADVIEKRSSNRNLEPSRPCSYTNKAYCEIDIAQNKANLEKREPQSFKLPSKPWLRHNYEEIENFRRDPSSRTSHLISTSSSVESGTYEDIDQFLGKEKDSGYGREMSVSKDEYYSRDELESLSSDDENLYCNALDVAISNDLIELEDSSSDDDDRIYYNLVHMKPPLIPMASDAEVKEIVYADPQDILDRKRKQREEHGVRFRHTSTEQRMKKTLHQRLSIEVTPHSPDGKSTSQQGHEGRLSVGSDSVFLTVGGEGTQRGDGTTSSVHLEVDRPGWDKRSSFPILDERDGEESPSGKGGPNEDQIQMRKWVITSILDSENMYLACLDILIQYMKSLQAAENTTQHVLPLEDINTIFFRLPEIYDIHKAFVEQLQPKVDKWEAGSQVASLFKELVFQQFEIYKEYLLNYKKAVATVQKCSQENEQFHELVKSIKGKGIQGSESLEQLLHKPVLRIQRNCMVLQDLVQWTPVNHPDRSILEGALKLSSHNIENLIDPFAPGEESSTRHLVKNSLIVEQVQGNRKLRHVFLFDDVIVCTKPKMGYRTKCASEVKWFIPVPCIKLDDLILAEVEQEFEKKRKQEVDALKKRVSVLKDDLKKEITKEEASKDRAFSFGGLGAKSVEKIKKKLVEQQAALVLASPKLVFRIHHKQNKVYTFLMSSDYEREEWREAVKTAQSKVPKMPNLSVFDVQSLVNSCRQIPRVNVLGTMLMRQGQDEEIMYGSLNVTVHKMMGMKTPADTFCCLEVDSFGTFSMQAKTNLICNSMEPKWNETFEISLDGSQTLRVLCYKQMSDSDLLLGKCALELNQNWLKKEFEEMVLSMGEFIMNISVQYVSREQTMKRVQSRIKTGVFGVKLETVLMRETVQIPTIVTACVAEVEKRGLNDVGIYRVSGVSSEIQRLKKLFEKSSKAGVDEIAEADIHAITGLLKLYFRELPEALFTDKLYRRFVDGLGLIDPIAKERCMLSLFKSLPDPNYKCIMFIIHHLILVSENETKNKMSIRNLATIFGPTLLRPAFNDEVAAGPEELLSMGTRDVFDQSGILQYFLELRQEGHDFSRY